MSKTKNNFRPLNDEEVKLKMKHLEMLVNELEWRRTQVNKQDGEDENSKIRREAREEIKKITNQYTKKEVIIAKDTHLFESRRKEYARLKLLQEKDKNVTDVVMCLYRRLGRIDHSSHKKAYRRILYALLVQGLCRLLEPAVVVVMRKTDVKLGSSIIGKAKEKYKFITGMNINVTVSAEDYLPLESCGGVDVFSSDKKKMVNNSLVFRLDQLVHKTCPMMRIALYGLNSNRTHFDLSKMCGSSSLFLFPWTNAALDEDSDNKSTLIERSEGCDTSKNSDNVTVTSVTHLQQFQVLPISLKAG